MNLTRRHRVVAEGRIRVSMPETLQKEFAAELRAFVRYCALRIERELGPRHWWTVVLAPRTEVGFLGTVVVRDRDRTLESRSAGTDAILTVWNAMCRIEQPLREACTESRVADAQYS